MEVNGRHAFLKHNILKEVFYTSLNLFIMVDIRKLVQITSYNILRFKKHDSHSLP